MYNTICYIVLSALRYIRLVRRIQADCCNDLYTKLIGAINLEGIALTELDITRDNTLRAGVQVDP